MTNHELPHKTEVERRQETRRWLDKAAALGALTLDHLLTIPPTVTSIEHHASLVRELKAKQTQQELPTEQDLAFVTMIENATQQLYEETELVAA